MYFKKIIWDIGRHPDLKLSADDKGKRGKSKTGANISVHTVHCWHESMINWNNIDDMHCLPVHFYIFVKAKKCHFCKRWFYWRTRNNEMKKKKHLHLSWYTVIECMWDWDMTLMCVWTHQHISSKRMMNLFFFFKLISVIYMYLNSYITCFCFLLADSSFILSPRVLWMESVQPAHWM